MTKSKNKPPSAAALFEIVREVWQEEEFKDEMPEQDAAFIRELAELATARLELLTLDDSEKTELHCILATAFGAGYTRGAEEAKGY